MCYNLNIILTKDSFIKQAIYSLEENICFDISLIVNKVQFRAIETWKSLFSISDIFKL